MRSSLKVALPVTLVGLALTGCTQSREGADSNSTAALSVVNLSRDFEPSDVNTFVTSHSHIFTISGKGNHPWLVRYSSTGVKQAEFVISNADYFAIRDIAFDNDTGNIGLLKYGGASTLVEMLNQSGDVVRTMPLKRNARNLALTLRQVFVLTDTALVRADDNTVLAQLPSDDAYCFFATKNAKLVAVAQRLPVMFIYDLATSTPRTIRLDMPQIVTTLLKTSPAKLSDSRPAIVGAAADDDGAIYIALAPDRFRLSILKLDDSGQVTGNLDAQLPSASNNRTMPMDVNGGIACLGDHLLVYSPFERKVAFYKMEKTFVVP